MKLNLVSLYSKQWLWLYLPVLCVSAFLIWRAVTVWYPLPPASFVLVGNLAKDNNSEMTWRYRDLLALKGITVQTVAMPGADEPLQQLINPEKQVDAAFAHGVLAKGKFLNIAALANVERHPVWFFTRNSNINRLSQIEGLRIGISKDGKLSKTVVTSLLWQFKLEPKDINLIDQDTDSAAAADLLQNRTDILILVASYASNSIRKLTRDPQIQLIGVDNVAAFTSREPRLKPFIFPQGAIDLRNNIPPHDMAVLYTNLHLLVRDNMHPALQRALLEAARDIHELPNFFQRQGEYPNIHGMDFTPSPVALLWSRGQRPWLETLLPYWWAQFAELFIFALIPIVLGTIYILRLIPMLFSLKVNAALQNFYGELKFLETDIDFVVSEHPIGIKGLLQQLDDIEAKVSAMEVPNRHANRWYILREDIARAREKILTLRSR